VAEYDSCRSLKAGLDRAVPIEVCIELGQKGVQIMGIHALTARWTVSTFSCDIA